MALTKAKKLEIGAIIRQRQTKLTAELQQDAAKVREEPFAELGGAPPGDAGDRASADLISDLNSAELSRDLLELRALDAALARLAEPGFGDCIDCGAEIDFERLRASPTALRCVACQRVHEKTYAHPGEPTL